MRNSHISATNTGRILSGKEQRDYDTQQRIVFGVVVAIAAAYYVFCALDSCALTPSAMRRAESNSRQTALVESSLSGRVGTDTLGADTSGAGYPVVKGVHYSNQR